MSRVPHVSDHALLRWMERYLEIDVEALRRAMLTPERVDAIRAGASAIQCAEGVVMIIAPNGTVTTVLTRRMRGRMQRAGMVEGQMSRDANLPRGQK